MEKHQLPPVQQPETESVNRQTDPSAGQRQLMPRPQFPANAQMHRSADARIRPGCSNHVVGTTEATDSTSFGQVRGTDSSYLGNSCRIRHRGCNAQNNGILASRVVNSLRHNHPATDSRAEAAGAGRQVNPNPSESPVQQVVNVEQLPLNPSFT